MTTTENGVHGQGLIFTIDMDSGEILRTLKMVGPPGWYARDGLAGMAWNPNTRTFLGVVTLPDYSQSLASVDPISGTFYPYQHTLIASCRTSDADSFFLGLQAVTRRAI
jgi:hypothetical protein